MRVKWTKHGSDKTHYTICTVSYGLRVHTTCSWYKFAMLTTVELKYIYFFCSVNSHVHSYHLVYIWVLRFTPIARHTLNPLTPKGMYSGRTAPLTSKRCMLYIYSTNTGTEYFKHDIYSQFFFSPKCSLFHNSNVFGFCFIHSLYTECTKI